MFKNTKDFVTTFERKMVSTYGRSVAQSHVTEQYLVLGEMVREYAAKHWKESKDLIASTESKQMYYFSMEFLIGRLLTNNLMNLGVYDIVRKGLNSMGIDVNKLEDLESDPGLGNGGLGRLAACFLDSLASLQLPGNGNCIRYQYGLFKQKIENGIQVEVPDQWLKLGNVWEIRKPKHAVDVKFYGRVELVSYPGGKLGFRQVDCEHVRAVPYDMPIVGEGTKKTNTLRLWSAEASDVIPKNKNFRKYLQELEEICLNVYPDDSNDEGKMLRLKQQYFFVSAGLRSIVDSHLRIYPNLDNFHEKVVIQLNDTHPVLCIPELMRLLMDEYYYEWEQAWEITTKSLAYTNHTVLSEALEKWPVHTVQVLLPRIWMIIDEISHRFKEEVLEKVNDADFANRVSIVKDGQIHMANLAIVGSFSVNGVAALHTEILINDVFKDFVKIYPERFNNKTNGITHRRWLLYSNPQLRKMLNDLIGNEFEGDMIKLETLMNYVDDKKVQDRFLKIKLERKQILADFIKQECKIDVDPNSIFDVQAKRLHAYKRQLLNVLHIIYLYQQFKAGKLKDFVPRTFIFAAKAAPSYVFAKRVIKLINSVAEVINHDNELNKLIKVVFIPNYRVSVAEILMNAADVSEQISTAGKEASGTGNMKFMMNGALTLGTLDGANVEIDELVGRENDIIFGATVEEVARIKKNYRAYEWYNNDERIKKAVESLIDGTWSNDPREFEIIYNDLIVHNDEYLVLADFASYIEAQEEVGRRYQDRSGWAKMMLCNIAKSGYFTSDRTIKQYAQEVWKIEPICMEE